MSEGLWILGSDRTERIRVDGMLSSVSMKVVDVSDRTSDPSVRRPHVAFHSLRLLLDRARGPEFVYRGPFWEIESRGSAHERAELHAAHAIGEIRNSGSRASRMPTFTAADLAALEKGLSEDGSLDDRLYPVGVVAEVRPGWEPSGPAGELRILDAITEYSARHLGALMGVESSPSA